MSINYFITNDCGNIHFDKSIDNIITCMLSYNSMYPIECDCFHGIFKCNNRTEYKLTATIVCVRYSITTIIK